MNIREYIVNNFKSDEIDTIKNTIEESIKSREEIVLPGLGVLFETLWEHSDNELKKTMLDIIKNNLTQFFYNIINI